MGPPLRLVSTVYVRARWRCFLSCLFDIQVTNSTVQYEQNEPPFEFGPSDQHQGMPDKFDFPWVVTQGGVIYDKNEARHCQCQDEKNGDAIVVRFLGRRGRRFSGRRFLGRYGY